MYTTNDDPLTSAAGPALVTQRGPGARPGRNRTLSVIIRFHQMARLPFLEEAIFSLAIQDWHDIETVVVLQNGTEEMRQAVFDVICRQPWQKDPLYRVLTVPIPEGVDGRSALLNEGIASASGRFLAFLDDDDFVYHHGYETLISQLLAGNGAIAIGGCRRANISPARDHWYVQSKDNSFFSWGRSRFDLFVENFVPIHSYVIDRSRLGSFALHFDDAFPPLEDYDFLLRLFARFEPDLTKLGTPVCEYRIRTDGSNSISYVADAPPETVKKQKRAQMLIQKRKASLIQQMPAELQRKAKEAFGPDFIEKHSLEVLPEGSPSSSDGDPPVACVLLEPASRFEVPQHEMPEDRRVLMQLVSEVYIFFSKHPRLESQLSRALHWLWRARRLRRKAQALPPNTTLAIKHSRLETKHELSF